MAEFTKGEYQIIPNADKKGATEFPIYLIARFPNGGVKGIALIRANGLETLPNANFLMASPAMYEALKAVVKMQSKPANERVNARQVWQQVDKALSLAEGREK